MNTNPKSPSRIDAIVSVVSLVAALGFAAYGAVAPAIAPLVA
ncbi:MAG: hypothetical protein ABSF50_19300 [Burkholderiaceae bacterium]|jgi:hypothetical protein